MGKAENLVPYQFQKGVSGNPNGRPPKLINMVERLPREAREVVYGRLWQAIQMPNVKEAAQFLEEGATEGDCGIILQIAARQLRSKYAWNTLKDIMDRLFGKPKQTTEISGVEGTPFELKVVQTTPELKDKVNGYLDGSGLDGQGV